MKALQFLTACCGLLWLNSCAIAPASVKRVIRPVEDRTLHALLMTALRSPDEAGSTHALAHFVERWRRERLPALAPVPAENGGMRYRVRFTGTECGGYPLDYFDEITPAADFEVRNLDHHMRSGVGAPLTALRENHLRTPLEMYFPPEVISRPLTAIARPGAVNGGVQHVTIDLLCPVAHPTVVVNGRRQPLAADFSVPWAAALARAGKLNQSRILDMLTSRPRRQPQLYLMEPYDPKREPLIMIHGLLSTPLVWAKLSNDLWADEAIRSRYQIWHFLYNASAPALYSARQLRTQLRDLRALLDPEGDDAAMQRTTLLTHSMGGLVGKALALRPGDAFWKAAFKVPHETLKLSAEDKTTLKEAFEWEPELTVHRIIFIAVPHRGSDFADHFVGRVGRWITMPPKPFRAFYERISSANPGVFTPGYQDLGRGRLDSVNSLSPRQPTLRILADLPFARPVSTHSIIGNRGRHGPLELSSDGIVPYTSSHLEATESETIVPAGHRAVDHPQTVAEIRRILKL